MKKILLIALIIAGTPSAVVYADTATTTPDTATFAIRDGATLLGPWSVTLADASTSPLSITPNEGSTTPIDLPARSALGVLESLATQHSDFSISSIKYFDFGTPYAGGLYLNCLSIPAAAAAPACNEWQFNVNNAALSQGAGIAMLGNNDSVFLYFGSPRSVSLSSATVTTGMPFTATAQTYNPVDNTFAPATGVTIGITEPNPNDPWNPIEVATSTVNSSGQATFTLQATSTYSVGIKEDYYSPASPLSVVDAAPAPATSTPPSTSGSAGGGDSVVHRSIDTSAALAYLSSTQHADGSFGSMLLSDWAALAFASTDTGAAKTKLHDYLLAATPTLSSVTDYERHALALEALGIDPRSGTPTDFIGPIVRAFDGTQIGDPTLDNDDIFALFPLLQAGYGTGDTLIQKATAFILSRQGADGSWDGSVDVTAAAIQALAEVSSLPDVSPALSRAEGYLHAEQQGNGGFGNSFSTSWALQAIAALHEPVMLFTQNGYTPQDYLATLQQTDGGIEPLSSSEQTRVWATAYAIPAALGKTWDSLLNSFARPGTGVSSSGASLSETSQVATSTSLLVATSTLPIATSTPEDMLISTSTPPISVLAPSLPLAATTSSYTVKVKSKAKTSPPPIPPARAEALLPAITNAQTAAVANAPLGALLSHLWNNVVTFFSSIL